ncbi:MAG TPA: c-type cytochrome [Edaphobacter sp.]|uniref:c-type cytochrome n=1 Tax=Edaphobacter sp. TaxID=1934404 RepID=UPI002D0EBA15|nr:c-type cytochrome [Edaphobacter sp.]HUZ95273.1 c-type cytochrome [Edaphobacter sp.]
MSRCERLVDWKMSFSGAHFRVLVALLVFSIPFGLYAPAQTKEKGPARNAGSPGAAGNQSARQILESHRCLACHGTQGQGLAQMGSPRIGPPSLGFPDFAKFVRHPTGAMPPFSPEYLSDSDLNRIYRYLKSIPPPSHPEHVPAGNAKNGALIYSRFGCYECHGREGQGALQTSAQRLGPPTQPFSAFAKYVHHPSGSMPPYTIKVVSDSQLADIYAFLKSIPMPPLADSIPLLKE